MSQIQSGSEATAAALVGSLATFSLFDVLDLLARTGHTGELQVVGRGVDQRVWIDRGDLLDPSGEGSRSTALFELACVEEGWFYFTLATAAPDGQTRVPVGRVVEDLAPQVDEWRTLVALLPFDARVSMSAAAPGPAVQIRSDQWHLLGLVGSPGRTVRAVVEVAEAHPLDTLRTLRELVDAHLVSLVLATPSFAAHAPANGLYEGTGTATAHAPGDHHAQPGYDEQQSGYHDPLSSAFTRDAAATAPASGVPSGQVPLVRVEEPADARSDPIPPAPEGFVERDESIDGPVSTGPAPPPSVDTNGSAMPPPITGDPWSPRASSAERQSAEDSGTS